MAQTGVDIARASQLLRDGKLVGVPTETVYGLAAVALNENAVLSVFETKERPFFDPLIIHVHSIDAARKYGRLNSEVLITLAERFWPGPLTILLEKNPVIPELVTSGLPRVAVRIPDHPLTLKLLQNIDLPLAAPSANPFGYISPTTAEHVQKQLGHKIEYILDGGPCKVGLESTIVSEENGAVLVHRLGGLAVEEIRKVCPNVIMQVSTSDNPLVPGQLKSHYAPSKGLLVGDLRSLEASQKGKKVSVIIFGKRDIESVNRTYNLSPDEDLHEAALNLFNFLRLADEDDSEVVIAEFLPDTGIGRAINDRLRRASAK